MLVAVGVAWQHERDRPTFTQDYRTERGQRLTIDLPDQSRLTLDAESALTVRLHRDRREIVQLRGRVYYAVAPDAQAPFRVQADRTAVEVTGTRFSVSQTVRPGAAPSLRVAVESGRVRVGPRAGSETGSQSTSAVELSAGQAVATDSDGWPGTTVSLPIEAVAPWRLGRILLRDATLADALAEFERYGSTGLSIRDPRVAALRVGGSFEVQRLDQFLAAITRMLPIRLDHQGAQTVIVATHPP